MGTNYYLKGHKGNNNPLFHIGKRSAAGMYCFDCKQTLCKDGVDVIHLGKSEWFKACPKCNQKPEKQTLLNSSIGLELGFNTDTNQKTGVTSCSSFTFAMPARYLALHLMITVPNYNLTAAEELEKLRLELGFKEPQFENEYGDILTRKEMIDIIAQCPIRFYNQIGREFS